MILICSARGARWLIEQPEGSSLPHHPRFQELLSIVKAACLKMFKSLSLKCLIPHAKL